MNIKFVVCGLEHTGTTLLSDLFRQIPGLDSGFEVGVLLAKTPTEFPDVNPFFGNMLKGWGMTQEELKACCAQPTHELFYHELKKYSSVISEKNSAIFDKTPRYLSQLDVCLQRTETPFVVSYKDPRAIVHSDFKRSGSEDFFQWYDGYFRAKKQYVSMCYAQHQRNKDNPRVEFIALEELALNARSSMERLFFHIGYDFSLDYLLLNGLRYKNTKSNAVSIPIAFSYLADFDKQKTDLIEKDFAEFSDWFYR